ncbi:Poly(A)-specific ribonuclease PARN [Neolecta irregularis DAH-3]|uniref:Poly(A)-specific ribonuclease PARN n=1 Tax=Neolecta irregularis (strain DAH-3) TaxID=1198029 RepID=A0A1U7LNX0_NEOID|nr:Poly(A)-specific ribonuclease PARN [Neolecta irregularis DAH-3]|eukprot:OLL24221.1 Poly(A)-specific ribonuclease PARN [Neolecta irregularis DAH-3]
MEVTRETFPELLKSILISIEEAEFVAIDCEYSGICIARSSSLQTPAERYLQTKEAAELFTVVQFGICPVKWISEKNEFQCSPYNFNISPTLFDRIKDRGLNRHYSNQAGSIDFLLQHGFDFNKQLTEGLYYLNEQEESLLLKYGTAQKTELQHDLKAARGIRIVLEHISKTKKPIIGHNVFGDITRIYCNLMKGTLPDTLPDFCLRITNAFPTIIDTKYLARREARLGISDDTSLSRLASWVDEHGLYVQVTFDT